MGRGVVNKVQNSWGQFRGIYLYRVIFPRLRLMMGRCKGFGSCYFLPFMVPCKEYAIKNFLLIYYFLKIDFLVLKNRG